MDHWHFGKHNLMEVTKKKRNNLRYMSFCGNERVDFSRHVYRAFIDY